MTEIKIALIAGIIGCLFILLVLAGHFYIIKSTLDDVE